MTDLMMYRTVLSALETLERTFVEWGRLALRMQDEIPESKEALENLSVDYYGIANEFLYTRRELVGRSDNGVPREEIARILKDGIDRMLKTGEGRTG